MTRRHAGVLAVVAVLSGALAVDAGSVGAESAPPAPAAVGAAVASELARTGAVDVFVMLKGHDAGADVRDLQPVVSATEARTLSAVPGIEVGHRLQTVPAFSARITSPEQLDALAAEPDVLRIDVDKGAGTGALANTVPIIGADTLQASGYTGSGVTVAVLDSGADNDHPDLAGSIVHQACFGDDGMGGFCPNGTTRQVGAGAAEDDAGHGTHVTGIVRSAGVVSSVGVAPNSKIVSIKVTDNCSFAGCFYSFSEVTAALDYIVAHPALGIDVINMSLVTNATFAGNCDSAASYLMAAAATVSNLRAAGILPVAASGNNGIDGQMTAPACLSGVLSVAASDTADAMASFSNTDSATDVVAPGVNVVSDAIGGGTTTASGTSMASPATAGCVALIKQAVPSVAIASIESALKSTGTAVTRGVATYPRINCDLALAALAKAPAAPTAVIAMPGKTTTATGPLLVSFAGGANNGSPITNHTATCTSTNGGAAKSTTKKGSPISVGGLTKGKSYTCRVRAINALGTSGASAASAAVIVGSPAPPTKVHAVRGAVTGSKSAMKVSFKPGANNGGPIKRYTVACSSANGGAARSATNIKVNKPSPVVVKNLTHGKTYRCAVRATNARGAGPASVKSNAVKV